MDDERLGIKFWGPVLGLTLLLIGGIVIVFIVIHRAYVAWGAVGAMVFLFLVLIAFAWIHDRREQARYEES